MKTKEDQIIEQSKETEGRGGLRGKRAEQAEWEMMEGEN